MKGKNIAWILLVSCVVMDPIFAMLALRAKNPVNSIWTKFVFADGICILMSILYLIVSKNKKPSPKVYSTTDGSNKGIMFERIVASWLKRSGFYNIALTQTSGDYGVDITASKETKRYAIQCKNYTGSVGIRAIQEVYSGKAYYGCDEAMVITNSGYTKAAKQLAKKNGVILIEYFDSSTRI